MTPAEEWRPITGYEGLYEVSNHGRVRSLDRWVDSPNRWGGVSRQHRPGRILAQKRKKTPTHAYAVVTLSRDGVPDTRPVHLLVLETFVGPRPPGGWGRHGPIGISDNGVWNLSWGTPSDNAYDRVRDGNDVKTNLTHCPWGHRLALVNLDPWWWETKGFRRCRACALTGSWGRYRGLNPGDEAWLAEAHRRYDEILHFGHPLDYRQGGVRWTPSDGYATLTASNRT